MHGIISRLYVNLCALIASLNIIVAPELNRILDNCRGLTTSLSWSNQQSRAAHHSTAPSAISRASASRRTLSREHQDSAAETRKGPPPTPPQVELAPSVPDAPAPTPILVMTRPPRSAAANPAATTKSCSALDSTGVWLWLWPWPFLPYCKSYESVFLAQNWIYEMRLLWPIDAS